MPVRAGAELLVHPWWLSMENLPGLPFRLESLSFRQGGSSAPFGHRGLPFHFPMIDTNEAFLSAQAISHKVSTKSINSILQDVNFSLVVTTALQFTSKTLFPV